ncbi:MAG: hypothetical protein J7480_03680 [Microbacteriaceae bacterium]|nr:hypothetical protein [Microbacteriaceae bacterium]
MPVPMPPRRHRRRPRRLLSLLLLRARSAVHPVTRRLMLFSGWTWFAAGSLVGFETLDMILAASAFAPEALPLILATLAIAWYVREWWREDALRHRPVARGTGLQSPRRIMRAIRSGRIG